MLDRTDHARARGPSLFGQIAATLGLLIIAFAVFNALLVTAIYAADRSQLARDMIRIEAAKVARDYAQGRPPTRPLGATDWRWTLLDASGHVLGSGGDRALVPPSPFGAVDWTSFQETPEGLWIAGATKIEGGEGDRWVGLVVSAKTGAIFTRAMTTEILEHVVLPVGPLAALLLAFSLWQVRRLTRPLREAAAEVDALDPAMLEGRLSEPRSPQEVRVLVEAMNRALARIEAGTRLVREFNANAAHELRTPLSIMRLAIDRLPPSEAADQLRGDVTGVTRIVTQMLDLAQADAMTDSTNAPVDLRALAEDLVAQMAPLAWAAKRDIRFSGDGSPVVDGHAEAIARALRNLIENALRHTPEGSAVTVTVGPGPRLRVGDHGPGVPPEDRQRVFERFWRADRGRSDGAGLGLGIVQATMEAHGGAARVEDVEGGGALFVLDFGRAG